MQTFTSNQQTHESGDVNNSYSGESSRGAVYNNEQNRISSLKQHDEQLRVALADICEQMSIPDGIAASIADAVISDDYNSRLTTIIFPG